MTCRNEFKNAAVFYDVADIAGSGKIAENVCYESTALQAKTSDPFATSIEIQATIWNVAYATTSLRHNKEADNVYETIGDAKETHK